MSQKAALCYHRKSRVRAGAVLPASPEMLEAIAHYCTRELCFIPGNSATPRPTVAA